MGPFNLDTGATGLSQFSISLRIDMAFACFRLKAIQKYSLAKGLFRVEYEAKRGFAHSAMSN
jgi:hypothetical protein